MWFIYSFMYFVYWVAEPGASHMLGKYCTTEALGHICNWVS